MGKGEIAHEQFLLFPQCFQKTCTAGPVLEKVKIWILKIPFLYNSTESSVKLSINVQKIIKIAKFQPTQADIGRYFS